METESTGVAHFVVTGEFLTDHARQLWAEEKLPDRAVGLLMMLHGIDLAQVMDVLIGRNKLVGDSSQGVELVEDAAELSPHGMPLPSLKEMFEILKKRAEVAERDLSDTVDLEAGNGVLVSNPGEGTRRVSRQTAAEVRAGKLGWDDMRVYREKWDLGKDPAPDYEGVVYMPVRPDPPPLKPTRLITGDTGWLSPGGKFYPCSWQEHLNLADRIQRGREQDAPLIGGHEYSLEKQGWIKLSGKDGVFQGDRDPTKVQKSVLFEWCMGDGRELTKLPWFLEPVKDE